MKKFKHFLIIFPNIFQIKKILKEWNFNLYFFFFFFFMTPRSFFHQLKKNNIIKIFQI